MILILTNKQDGHTDAVIRRLRQKDVAVFRLNTEDLLVKYRVNLYINSKGEWDGEITDELNRVLSLKNLKVAWLRKPDFDFILNLPMTTEVREFIVSETKSFINILYSIPSIKWINNPFVSNSSKVKFQQLLLASKMGIKIPKTLITTQPEKAKDFFIECNETILLKSIYSGNITIDGRNQGILSKKLTKNDFYKNYKNISINPTQLQEYIEKAYELRITVIEEKVFAIKIDSQVNEETKIDWRLHTKMNPHTIFNLPNKIENFCINFLKKQGLIYGALDFIVTPNNEYVFLENNPFGQYLWLENETGIPLTEEIVNLLVKNMKN